MDYLALHQLRRDSFSCDIETAQQAIRQLVAALKTMPDEARHTFLHGRHLLLPRLPLAEAMQAFDDLCAVIDDRAVIMEAIKVFFHGSIEFNCFEHAEAFLLRHQVLSDEPLCFSLYAGVIDDAGVDFIERHQSSIKFELFWLSEFLSGCFSKLSSEGFVRLIRMLPQRALAHRISIMRPEDASNFSTLAGFAFIGGLDDIMEPSVQALLIAKSLSDEHTPLCPALIEHIQLNLAKFVGCFEQALATCRSGDHAYLAKGLARLVKEVSLAQSSEVCESVSQ